MGAFNVDTINQLAIPSILVKGLINSSNGIQIHGFTCEGLAFAITMSPNENQIKQILPLIDDYAEELSASSNQEKKDQIIEAIKGTMLSNQVKELSITFENNDKVFRHYFY